MKALFLAALTGLFTLSISKAGSIAVDVSQGMSGLVSGFGGMTLGWEFEVLEQEGITVDGLGFWDHQGDGFLFGQSFPVGLWDAASGERLGVATVTSTSTLQPSRGENGSWRVASINSVHLKPGLYRIGALMPSSGGNQIVVDNAVVEHTSAIRMVRHLRQLGSATLAMPDLPMNSPQDVNFGPTFTFVTAPVAPTLAVVAPPAYSQAEGPTGVNTLVRRLGEPRSYQMQFSAASMVRLPVPSQIIGLGFRADASSAANFPSTTARWGTYEVTLAKATRSVAEMSPQFAENMCDAVIVKSGALTINANTFIAGSSPNQFGVFMSFDRPYLYEGGDLVMLFRHGGSDGNNVTFFDGVTTVSPGYGTDFRAFGTNSFSAAEGLPQSITIAQLLYARPLHQRVEFSGNDFVIVGGGGTHGAPYRLLKTTSASAPLMQWNEVTVGLFESDGTFRYTNRVSGGLPAEFFQIVME